MMEQISRDKTPIAITSIVMVINLITDALPDGDY